MTAPMIPPPQPGDSSSMWVKPKVRQRRAIANLYGCLLGIAMLLSGLLAGIFGTYLFAPVLYGWSVTQTAIWSDVNQTARADAAWFATQNAALISTAGAQALTADALRSQAQGNDTRATEIVLMMNQTQAALNNELNLLENTATQSSANVIATRTADAVNNARQMTAIALDQNATQARLQQNATQVELDFRETQASIDQNATDIAADNQSSLPDSTADVAKQDLLTATDSSAGSVVAQAVTPSATLLPEPVLAPSLTPTIRPTDVPTLTATPVPTETPLPTATETPVPSATPVPVLDINGLRRSNEDDWLFDTDDGSIRSTTGGAWLLTEETYRGNFVLSFSFLPAYQPDPEYLILLNMPETGNGLVLRLQANGLQVRSVGLYQLAVDALIPPVNITENDLRELTEQSANLRLTGDNELRVAWQGNTLAVLLNDTPILQSTVSSNPPDGAIGILVPAGVRFFDISFTAAN
ncbi:MAG: hypothetical protein ACPG7F_09905 [Aggregatilineales bacterium]